MKVLDWFKLLVAAVGLVRDVVEAADDPARKLEELRDLDPELKAIRERRAAERKKKAGG